uniref:Uncharacterized protein n=1 Tax=Oryza glumipatula TaxID=40148 RepID=A0A0G2KBN7_9ORYZ
MIITVRII